MTWDSGRSINKIKGSYVSKSGMWRARKGLLPRTGAGGAGRIGRGVGEFAEDP